MEMGRRLAGAAGMLATATGTAPATAFRQFADAGWTHGYLFARALTIGGGTGEVQRNILAERVLGLPRDATPTTLSAHGNQAS